EPLRAGERGDRRQQMLDDRAAHPRVGALALAERQTAEEDRLGRLRRVHARPGGRLAEVVGAEIAVVGAGNGGGENALLGRDVARVGRAEVAVVADGGTDAAAGLAGSLARARARVAEAGEAAGSVGDAARATRNEGAEPHARTLVGEAV